VAPESDSAEIVSEAVPKAVSGFRNPFSAIGRLLKAIENFFAARFRAIFSRFQR
jgi:hypothetical protein